ncbi:MAG: PAS domain-containing protein [Methanomicrobiales archaeon]|nr:PAS domain-containing protein [Methanomicrobiales archaeon]
MNLPAVLKGRDGLWNAAIIGAAVCALGINLTGLLVGITIVLPHLLYVPVVIAAYRYPKQGLLFAGCIGVIYVLMVLAVAGMVSLTVAEAVIRALVLIAIGGLIAALTLRLRNQESLYQGLFDNSEAGSILIRNEDGTWRVEETNWNAASLLKQEPADLKDKPLTAFWSNGEEEILDLFAREGKVYAREAELTTADGQAQKVLMSMAGLPENRAILTFVDITRRVAAEQALQSARGKLQLLSRISGDHLNRTVHEMIETLDSSAAPEQPGLLSRVRTLAGNLARQLSLAATYQDLGTRPPQWIPVERILESLGTPAGGVFLRFWAERLEVYADPLFRDVLTHVVENALRHGKTLENLVVTYQHKDGGLDIVIEDDGVGIPAAMKDAIFEYDSGGHSGLGLFICREILGVTGMTMSENGSEGTGARFVIHVPEGYYRIEGTGDAPPFPVPAGGAGRGVRYAGGTLVRELTAAEFPVADALWVDYHNTTGDPVTDRIFAAFADSEAVSLARCRRHPDGLEVDGIFTPERHRGHGYANAAVRGLIEACGHDLLYMHSVLNLTGFYAHYGFVPIPEEELPPTIRERFAWAGGEMEGANVAPMMRYPAEQRTTPA